MALEVRVLKCRSIAVEKEGKSKRIFVIFIYFIT